MSSAVSCERCCVVSCSAGSVVVSSAVQLGASLCRQLLVVSVVVSSAVQL